MFDIPILPADITPLVAIVLVASSFFTSALTAAIGLGGGLVLLAAMASLLPPLAAIPVHGVVQLGSNAGRTLVQLDHVRWRLLIWFAAGAVAGAVVGGQIVIALPAVLLRIAVGLFVLWAMWGVRPKLTTAGAAKMAAGGFVSTVLTMFVGATGMFIAALLGPQPLEKRQLVGTHAAAMSLQHSLKVLVFGFLGFTYLPWLLLIAAMIGAGFAGTLAGSKLLDRMPERVFRQGFKWVLTAIAVQLIVRGLMG